MSVHVSSAEWSAYYRQYAEHFEMLPHIRFNTTVKVIRRDHDKNKWNVFIEGEDQPQVFDKVVFCSGSETMIKQPRIDDLDKFKGKIIHGQAYKR
jgi:dimethylaniline monooxygenase (N-oxide forming)